jgi:uncharacterized protein
VPQTGYAFNTDRQAFLATAVRKADTHWSRLRGLIGEDERSFPAGSGLWIVPCHGVHTFAMQFPIDVLYLSESLRVQRIEENVKPWRLTPFETEAATVLELPARTLWNSGTTLGDRIEIVFDHGAAKEECA